MPSFNEVLYNTLGNRIKTIRESRNMTQSSLAEEVGLGRSSMSNIEKGNQQPPLHVLYKICEVLNTEIHLLLPTYSQIVEKTSTSDVELYINNNGIDENARKYINKLINQTI